MKPSMIRAALSLLLLVSSAIPISGTAAKSVIPTILHVPGEVSTLDQAISQIGNGGIIELAAGTYLSPPGGFGIHDTHKGFTIRAASGAQVTISGNGTHELVRLINSNVSQGGPVIFQGLKFFNGYSNTPGLAGGVTVMQAQATFVDCVFESNVATQNGAGGGTLVAINSEAFFINSVWQNNSAAVSGGGLEVAEQSKVYIHNAEFLNNRVNLPGHSPVSAGGAIHVGNSILRVSNTRFENNQAGYAGGALYIIGNWVDPVTQPSANLIIVNSTFINNQAIRDPGVSYDAPTEGGAVLVEAQTRVRIYNSRFITNNAMAGGAISNYRAELWVEGSSFFGNTATGPSGMGGFGGAISAGSNDTASDGSTNRRVAYINIQDTLIQGRYGNVTTVGLGGGGIYANGDKNRTYGTNGVSQQGTAADNRAQVEINRVVFNDLDVYNSLDGGVGGGMLGDLVALNLQNSLMINSDATGSSKSSGGGLAVLNQSLANISDLTFSRNSTDKFGGAIFAQGSELNLSNCNLIENLNPTQYGSAIFAAQDDGRIHPATGTVQTSVFSNNTGLPMIFDDDRTNGPINDMHYNNNQFYNSSGVNATIYKDPLYSYSAPVGTSNSASQLNDRVVSRNNGTSTDKGSGNTALSSAPKVGKILAAPPQILTTTANGDAAPPTLAYLGYAWSGGSATLDGLAVNGNAGVSSAGTGSHTLSVGGTNYTGSISQAPTPAATFTASGASPVTLNWSVTAGTFLDVAIDRGVTIPSSSSGSVQVSPPVDMDYWLYVITKEGGIVKSVYTGMPILNVPAAINPLAGLNYSVNKGAFTIQNDGGGTLQWTATSQTPNLITMDTANGQTTTGTIMIAFTLNVGSLSPGDYVGIIKVDAGAGGTALVTVNVKVVNILYKIYLPLVLH